MTQSVALWNKRVSPALDEESWLKKTIVFLFQTSDDEQHCIRLHRSGALVLENHRNDLREQLALLQLGGKVCDCVRFYQEWTHFNSDNSRLPADVLELRKNLELCSEPNRLFRRFRKTLQSSPSPEIADEDVSMIGEGMMKIQHRLQQYGLTAIADGVPGPNLSGRVRDVGDEEDVGLTMAYHPEQNQLNVQDKGELVWYRGPYENAPWDAMGDRLVWQYLAVKWLGRKEDRIDEVRNRLQKKASHATLCARQHKSNWEPSIRYNDEQFGLELGVALSEEEATLVINSLAPVIRYVLMKREKHGQ